MNRVTLFTTVALITALAGSQPAHAVSCPIAGTQYTCDIDCAGIVAPNVCAVPNADFNLCDTNHDGKCVMCGDGNNNIIIGSTGPDIICGKNGNDTIRGEPSTSTVGGDDLLSGDAGNDYVYGGPGNDTIYGGTGNDNLFGGSGDDEIFGEAGDDMIHGEQGADALNGGDGNDYVEGSTLYQEGDLGDLLCGGKGNDILEATGDGSHCLDAGPDQVAGENLDCVYNGPSSPEDGDRATARNCANYLPDGIPGTSDAFNPSHRSCNCSNNN